MPERTTEDYEGQPSMKVQQAIQAILQDENTQENVPINQLINFNDRLLEDYFNPEKVKARNATSQAAARPKSGKRPKSAKKKASQQ